MRCNLRNHALQIIIEDDDDDVNEDENDGSEYGEDNKDISHVENDDVISNAMIHQSCRTGRPHKYANAGSGTFIPSS